MKENRDEITHDLNNLIVKFKSICSLLLGDDDCGIDTNQMIQDGDLTIRHLSQLWDSIKKGTSDNKRDVE